MAKYTVQATGTLTAAATKTLILLNPVTVPIELIQITASLDNITTDAEPVLFDIVRATTIGSPAGTTGTEVRVDESDPSTAQTTSLINLSTEPTTYEIIDSFYLTPHSGVVAFQFPLGREPKAKGAGERIGIRYTTVSGVTPKYVVTAWFEE